MKSSPCLPKPEIVKALSDVDLLASWDDMLNPNGPVKSEVEGDS